jgi:hypothetical protein
MAPRASKEQHEQRCAEMRERMERRRCRPQITPQVIQPLPETADMDATRTLQRLQDEYTELYYEKKRLDCLARVLREAIAGLRELIAIDEKEKARRCTVSEPPAASQSTGNRVDLPDLLAV